MTWLWLLGILFMLFGLVVFRGAPYVPSKKGDLKDVFDRLYKLDEKDLLVDVGSGDGIVLRLAASKGARAIGFELNPILVLISRALSWRDANLRVQWVDFWLKQLPKDTTVVYAFGETLRIKKMATRLQSEANRLQKTLFFISYAFEVPGKKPVNRTSTHFLYSFEPLLSNEP